MIGAIAGAVVGGLFANRAASKQAAAMQQQGAAQLEAARIAAEEARFRPVGITTRFASATPQFTDGRLTGYDYTASPELLALQNQLQGLYGSSLEQAQRAGAFQPQLETAGQGLFGLGQQLIPTSTIPQLTALEKEQLGATTGIGRQLLGDMSTAAPADVLEQQARLRGLAGQVTPTAYDPTAAAQSYYEEQQALLDPTRRRQEQRLAAGVFGRGRGGLSVGAEGQPELFALGQAREEQNARIAAAARERARAELQQDINLGSQLGQQAIATGQAGEQYRLSQLGTGLNMLGQGITSEEAARQRMLQNIQTGAGLYTQGAGLFGAGYGLQQAALSPFQSQFQLATQLEDVARQPMDIGTALGQKVTSANARAGELMGQGMSAAANLQSQAAQAKASGLASLGQGIAGLGRQYDQNVLFDQWMNRAFPTSAPIEERSLGGGMTTGINLAGGLGFPNYPSSGFNYITK